MTINLQDIRNAVKTYLDTKVKVSISLATPVDGSDLIGKDEEFSYKITVTNADAFNGGITLRNVRYHIWIENPDIALLIVPPVGPFPSRFIARKGIYLTSPVIPAGSKVEAMYLFPTGDPYSLTPGDVDTISILKGKSGRPPSGSNTWIRFEVIADVDMDWLFPKNENSPSTPTGTLSGRVVVEY